MNNNTDYAAQQREIEAWLEGENQRTAQMIREHGVYIEYVGAEPETRSTSFAYTIGLFELGHPELLILGVNPNTAAGVLNEASDRVRGGETLLSMHPFKLDGWAHHMRIESVPNPGQIAFGANRYYGRTDETSVPVLQLTYADRNGVFPWESGYSIPDWVQPRPGEFRA